MPKGKRIEIELQIEEKIANLSDKSILVGKSLK
jgi:hypothetical protein